MWLEKLICPWDGSTWASPVPSVIDCQFSEYIYSNIWTAWTPKADKKVGTVGFFYCLLYGIAFPTLQVVVNISSVDSVAMTIQWNVAKKLLVFHTWMFPACRKLHKALKCSREQIQTHTRPWIVSVYMHGQEPHMDYRYGEVGGGGCVGLTRLEKRRFKKASVSCFRMNDDKIGFLFPSFLYHHSELKRKTPPLHPKTMSLVRRLPQTHHNVTALFWNHPHWRWKLTCSLCQAAEGTLFSSNLVLDDSCWITRRFKMQLCYKVVCFW